LNFGNINPLDNDTSTGSLATITFEVLQNTPTVITLEMRDASRLDGLNDVDILPFINVSNGSVNAPIPTATMTTPASGATNVAVNTTVVITFSEAVQTAFGTITVAGAANVGGNVTWNAPTNTVATFTPAANLAHNTLHTVSVTGFTAAAAGNAAMASFTPATFTTVAAQHPTPNAQINFANETLTGLAAGTHTFNGTSITVPATGIVDINAAWFGQTVSIIRSASGGNTASETQSLSIPARPAAPTGLTPTGTPQSQSVGQIAGVTTDMDFRLLPTGAWTPITASPLTGLAAGSYEVRLGATASAFASLPTSPIVISELGIPTASMTTPASGATGVVVGTTVVITFSEAVQTGSGTISVTAAAVPIAGSVAWSAGDTVATFTPSANLALNTLHTVSVAGFTAAAAGNTPMAAFTPATFTTELGPHPTPTAAYSFLNGTLTGLAPGVHTFNGTSITVPAGGIVDIEAAWFGTTVSIIRVASGGFSASTAQSLSVSSRPAAPTGVGATDTTLGLNNGTLTGVTTAMEYRVLPAGAWIPITATTVTGLAAGSYEVRYQSTASAFASLPTAPLIILAPPVATVGNVTIGNLGGNVVVTLINDTFTTLITAPATWITNLPAGMTQTATRNSATQVTIAVSGIPTAVSIAPVEITIPAASMDISATPLVVIANPQAVFDTTVEPGAMVGNVTIGNAGGNVVITLVNDTFEDPITEPTTWITNLPAGMTQTVTRDSATQVTIAVSGTPTAASTAPIAITIPEDSLTVSSAPLDVLVNAQAVFNTTIPQPPSIALPPQQPAPPSRGMGAPSPQPGTPAFVHSSAMSAANREVRNIIVAASNATTAESVLSAIRAVLPSGSTANWSQGTPFALIPATADQAGSITGMITITTGPYSSAIRLNITIPALRRALDDETVRRIGLRLDSYEIIDLEGNVILQRMDVLPVVQNERTLIPVRFVAYALGATVGWNDAAREVTLALDGQAVTFAIGEMASGMDVPAQIINDRTFVPLRFIGEFFGAQVLWDENTRSIEIVR